MVGGFCCTGWWMVEWCAVVCRERFLTSQDHLRQLLKERDERKKKLIQTINQQKVRLPSNQSINQTLFLINQSTTIRLALALKIQFENQQLVCFCSIN